MNTGWGNKYPANNQDKARKEMREAQKQHKRDEQRRANQRNAKDAKRGRAR